MAKWIRHRPASSADPTEKEVADVLAKLPDTWTIRWGYFYADNDDVEREGDFLLLSPEGEVLVFEVKGGTIRTFAKSGDWENAADDNPYVQLLAEWSAVLDKLQKKSTNGRLPFVRRFLCYPHQPAISVDIDYYQGIPRREFLDKQQLEAFSKWWSEQPKRHGDEHQRAANKQLFRDVFASGITPKAQEHFLDETDRILERHTEHEFRLLDQLQDNRQLLVRGGTGSGKTSLALEQAQRWAAEGQRVLLLCYNLPLQDRLAAMVVRQRAAKGSVDVRSFEALGAELCPAEKQPFVKGGTAQQRKASDMKFFDETLPQAMSAAVSAPHYTPRYDALVVDEGQDHNTGDSAIPPPAWWSIYLRLLDRGGEAPIAVFYDPAQRLPWRSGSFDVARLENFLVSPVKVRLTRPLRYTRNILRYLDSLVSPETRELIEGIKNWESAPVGPEIEESESSSDLHEANLITEIISRWQKEGLAHPEDVMVLHAGRSNAPQWTRKQTSLLDTQFPPARGKAAVLSMHRAKGLEARAVIVVARGRFSSLTDTIGEQHAFFLACSRARQLLALVYRKPSATPKE